MEQIPPRFPAELLTEADDVPANRLLGVARQVRAERGQREDARFGLRQDAGARQRAQHAIQGALMGAGLGGQLRDAARPSREEIGDPQLGNDDDRLRELIAGREADQLGGRGRCRRGRTVIVGHGRARPYLAALWFRPS
jgi:hypothetical protein